MQKQINHNGSLVVYRDLGKGDAVVLLHGFAEGSEIWNTVLSSLQDYRLIIPDLPGSGDSALPDDVSMEAMAEAIHSILTHEKINEPVLIGHSMGGYITLAFIEKYPEAIKAFGLFH